MTGAEIAWRTLNMEQAEEPCILSSWVMKRDFYRHYAKVHDIYADPVRTVVEAFANAGANLNPQFIMPSPTYEHIACAPERVVGAQITAPKEGPTPPPPQAKSPEDVRDAIEQMPDPEKLKAAFDVEAVAEAYARPLLERRALSRDRTLFIGGFGIPGFMSGYTTWGYENYMCALALYPEHLRRYYALSAERGCLRNIAVVEAVRRHDLAPFAYTGDDICFNDGPICNPEILDDLYFPALRYAVQPLIEADIRMIWHCDGDIRPILPQLLDAGMSGFQGFQEEAGVTLEEMAALRTRWGRKPILWGSVSVTTTLPFGTVENVKRRVEHCFEAAGPGGGFGLASTSSILPETPLENIIALFEHGRAFGHHFYETGPP